MNWTTLIITLMSSTISHNLKQTMQNDQLIFNGFDCRVPKKIVSFLTKDWCQPAKVSDKNALGEKKIVTILQRKISNSKRHTVHKRSQSISCVLWQLLANEILWTAHSVKALSDIHRGVRRRVPMAGVHPQRSDYKSRVKLHCVNSNGSSRFSQS